MRFTKVEKTEDVCRRKKGVLKSELMEFIRMDVKCAKVTFSANEYESPHSAYAALFKAAERHAFPIKVIKRGDNIYVIRTDM